MAYLSDISAHSPQVLHFDKTQSLRMASRCGLSVFRVKSASILNRHPMRSDAPANESGSATIGGEAVFSLKTLGGNSGDTLKPFAMINPPCGNEPAEGERCQWLDLWVSASASSGIDCETADISGFWHFARQKVRHFVTPTQTRSGV